MSEIRPISQEEFQRRHSWPGSGPAREISWWETDDGRIGTVLLDLIDNDYSFVAMAPGGDPADGHPPNVMAAIALGVSIATEEEATQRLAAALQAGGE